MKYHYAVHFIKYPTSKSDSRVHKILMDEMVQPYFSELKQILKDTLKLANELNMVLSTAIVKSNSALDPGMLKKAVEDAYAGALIYSFNETSKENGEYFSQIMDVIDVNINLK